MEAPKTIEHEIGGIQNDALRFGLHGVKSNIIESHPLESAYKSVISLSLSLSSSVLLRWSDLGMYSLISFRFFCRRRRLRRTWRGKFLRTRTDRLFLSKWTSTDKFSLGICFFISSIYSKVVFFWLILRVFSVLKRRWERSLFWLGHQGFRFVTQRTLRPVFVCHFIVAWIASC